MPNPHPRWGQTPTPSKDKTGAKKNHGTCRSTVAGGVRGFSAFYAGRTLRNPRQDTRHHQYPEKPGTLEALALAADKVTWGPGTVGPGMPGAGIRGFGPTGPALGKSQNYWNNLPEKNSEKQAFFWGVPTRAFLGGAWAGFFGGAWAGFLEALRQNL
jgi:hypothetical protein